MKYLGGVYLDMDIFLYVLISHPVRSLILSIKPLDDLFYSPTTMGMQGLNYGLCAGILISSPFSSFIARFLDSYHHFYGDDWDFNSVQNSLRIARRYPDELQILTEQAFFYPDSGDGRPFVNDEWDFDASGQYVYVEIFRTPSLHESDWSCIAQAEMAQDSMTDCNLWHLGRHGLIRQLPRMAQSVEGLPRRHLAGNA